MSDGAIIGPGTGDPPPLGIIPFWGFLKTAYELRKIIRGFAGVVDPTTRRKLIREAIIVYFVKEAIQDKAKEGLVGELGHDDVAKWATWADNIIAAGNAVNRGAGSVVMPPMWSTDP